MSDHRLRVSVIIAAYNEEELLPSCLARLMPQAERHDAEVVVVDNHSTDHTATVARNSGATVIAEPQQGYAAALRRGVQSAHNEIIAVTDADTIVSETWLAEIEKAFENPEVVATTGQVLFQYAWPLSLLHWLFRHDLWGANMAFRKSAYDKVGGLDINANFCSDVLFGKKLRAHGIIAFRRKQSVVTSSRRFHAQPIRQSLHYIKNYLWLVVTGKPKDAHFDPIRLHETRVRRRALFHSTVFSLFAGVVVTAYFFAWPRSTDFGLVSVRSHTQQKLVALTFDDGPNGKATRAIVDTLVAYHVPATFFEVGKSVQADPSTASYVSSHGFVIGNHTWDHRFTIPLMTTGQVRREIQSTESAINTATGTLPAYFRPPHGLRSPQMFWITQHQHLRTIDWSVDPHDYLTDNSMLITERIVRSTRPGSIILLHDGLLDGPRAFSLRFRQGTIAALPAIITTLRNNGYHFVSIETLLSSQKTKKHHFLRFS